MIKAWRSANGAGNCAGLCIKMWEIVAQCNINTINITLQSGDYTFSREDWVHLMATTQKVIF